MHDHNPPAICGVGMFRHLEEESHSVQGKRRLLSIYFGRIITVFVGMWLPFLVLVYVAGYWLSPWVLWAGGVFGHLQAAASTALSLLKPDMAKAFTDLVCCRVVCGSPRSPNWCREQTGTQTTTIPEQQDGQCNNNYELAEEFSVEEATDEMDTPENIIP